jgi:hypothetical protein
LLNILFLFSERIIENLRDMPFAPSAPLQQVPRDFRPDDYNINGEDSEHDDADFRMTRKFLMLPCLTVSHSSFVEKRKLQTMGVL